MNQGKTAIQVLQKNKVVLLRWRTAFFVVAAALGVTITAALLYVFIS